MEDIVIINRKELDGKIKKFSEGGKDKLHIISDFDRTLTKAFVNGEEIPSLISVLRNENYLTQDYSQKAHALHDKYYPIEINPDISLDKKKKAMQEWWTSHFDLLIKSKLNKKDIEKVVKSEKIEFREGTLKFLDLLHNNDIPLVILSSAGLGMESIQMYLNNKKILYDNIYIISNSFKWDKNGYVIAFNNPIIHCMNKDETLIKKFPFYDIIKNKKNVLLLGDSLGDVDMAKGLNYNNLIKIGFLNMEIEKNINEYKKNFDVVILNDGSMDYVNGLLKKII